MSYATGRYTGVRVLVFGASGFIGRWVARQLSRHDAELFLAVRDPLGARGIFAEYGVRGTVLPTTLSTAADVQSVFDAARPSITFNLAGYGVDRTERDEAAAVHLNERVVRWIAAAAASRIDRLWPGQHLVHAGSALEYGTIGGHLEEDALPHPTTMYGRSKLAGTRALSDECLRRNIRGLTARLFTVYGAGEHPGRLLPSLLAAAEHDADVELSTGEQRRDFTLVDDVAQGLLRLGLTTTPPGWIVNLATGRLESVRRFAEIAAAVLDLPSAALRFGALPSRTDDMAHDDVAVDRLRLLTGWVPETVIADGIRHTKIFRQAHAAGASILGATPG